MSRSRTLTNKQSYSNSNNNSTNTNNSHSCDSDSDSSSSSSTRLPECEVEYSIAPGSIPVFRPTWSQFRDFNRFMQLVHSIGIKYGLIKVIPPSQFKPNKSNYNSNSSSVLIHNPIRQNVTGRAGIYRLINEKVCNNISVSRFYSISAENEKNRSARELQWNSVKDYLELERAFWKNVGFSSPLYGADSSGTLFDSDCQEWNMNKLDSLLDLIVGPVSIGGVTSPMLYWGQWKSMFGIHVEDMNLYSMNYIHFGKPKQWYAVSSINAEQLENYCRLEYSQLYKHCKQFIRHKEILISPTKLQSHNIPVFSCIQNSGEFMVTFPRAYHQGFNYGFNCAESVNFAAEQWLTYGYAAEPCRCRDSSVTLDIYEFDRKITALKGVYTTEIAKSTDNNTTNKKQKKPNNNNNSNNNDSISPSVDYLTMSLIRSNPILTAELDRLENGEEAEAEEGEEVDNNNNSNNNTNPKSSRSMTGLSTNSGSRSMSGIVTKSASAILIASADIDTDAALASASSYDDEPAENYHYDEDFYINRDPLACGYPDCDSELFRTKSALLNHYAKAHSNNNNNSSNSNNNNSKRKLANSNSNSNNPSHSRNRPVLKRSRSNHNHNNNSDDEFGSADNEQLADEDSVTSSNTKYITIHQLLSSDSDLSQTITPIINNNSNNNNISCSAESKESNSNNNNNPDNDDSEDSDSNNNNNNNNRSNHSRTNHNNSNNNNNNNSTPSNNNSNNRNNNSSGAGTGSAGNTRNGRSRSIISPTIITDNTNTNIVSVTGVVSIDYLSPPLPDDYNALEIDNNSTSSNSSNSSSNSESDSDTDTDSDESILSMDNDTDTDSNNSISQSSLSGDSESDSYINDSSPITITDDSQSPLIFDSNNNNNNNPNTKSAPEVIRIRKQFQFSPPSPIEF